MFLHRIHLDQRCREARRDLSDAYQLHATLCRAFSAPERKCSNGEFLWRLEPEIDSSGHPRILVQSRSLPDWQNINVKGWLAEADPAIELEDRLNFHALKVRQRFRFRLRANPCVCRNGKRLGLLQLEEQESWLERKGREHGFLLPELAAFDFSEPHKKRVDVRITQKQMLRAKQHFGNAIHIFSVLYDGILLVTEPEKFKETIQNGLGHGKAMGLGMLSIAPVK